MFEAWKASPAYVAINNFVAKRGEIERIEPSVKDISYDLQPFLDALFELVAELKVPGRKAKCKCLICLFVIAVLTVFTLL